METSAFYDVLKSIDIESRIQDRVRRRGYDVDRKFSVGHCHKCLRMKSPFRYFKTLPEIIRLAVMMYVRFPVSLRNVEDLLHKRGIEVGHETIRFW